MTKTSNKRSLTQLVRTRLCNKKTYMSLQRAIKKEEHKLREINEKLSTSYPRNYQCMENEEKKLKKKVKELSRLKRSIQNAYTASLMPMNLNNPNLVFNFTPIVTRSLDRKTVRNLRKSRSPNRRTVNKVPGLLFEKVQRPIGSLPMVKKITPFGRSPRYGLRGAENTFKKNRNLRKKISVSSEYNF